MSINYIFMEKALEIAFSKLGKTSPNPPVGAVITRNNEIISCGGTSPYGSDHAEVVAIKNAKIDLQNAELYVSLEPCSHHGKTPPCTDAIIQSKIKKVYIPILDPNPIVAGKGIKTLKKAGVDVTIVNEMSHDAADLIRPFKKFILNQKPYIIHKSAITLDGRIATTEGDSKWISSDYSRYIVHRLRSHIDAIIIGKNTFSIDNPTLNIRLDSFSAEVKQFFQQSSSQLKGMDNFFLKMLLNPIISEEESSPLRIIIGLPDEFNLTNNIFFDENFLFFIEEKKKDSLLKIKNQTNLEKLIHDDKITFIRGNTKIEQISDIMNNLFKLGKMFIMLEGGASLAGSFYESGEIDQFLYFISPKIIGKGIAPIEGKGVRTIKESLILHDISIISIKKDLLYNAYKEKYNFNV